MAQIMFALSGITRFYRKKLTMSPASSPWQPWTTLPRRRCADRLTGQMLLPTHHGNWVNSVFLCVVVLVRLQHRPHEGHGPVRAGEAAAGRDREPFHPLCQRRHQQAEDEFQPGSRGGNGRTVFLKRDSSEKMSLGILSEWILSDLDLRLSGRSVQEPPRQFFFDLNRKQGGGRGRKRPSEGEGRGRPQYHDGGGDHRGQPKQPRRPRESCDTCDQCVWSLRFLYFIFCFVNSSTSWSLLVLSGQPSGGETPRHQHRDTRECQTEHQAKQSPSRTTENSSDVRSVTWQWRRAAWLLGTYWSCPSVITSLWWIWAQR